MYMQLIMVDGLNSWWKLDIDNNKLLILKKEMLNNQFIYRYILNFILINFLLYGCKFYVLASSSTMKYKFFILLYYIIIYYY